RLRSRLSRAPASHGLSSSLWPSVSFGILQRSNLLGSERPPPEPHVADRSVEERAAIRIGPQAQRQRGGSQIASTIALFGDQLPVEIQAHRAVSKRERNVRPHVFRQ